MDIGLWIIGGVLILDGILLAWLRRRGTLANFPAYIPLIALVMGVIALIAAFLATR